MANARIGVYPGTFDPITLGHVDVIRRALALVDKLVIGVAVNAGKGPLFSLDRRIELVREEMTPLARANGTELEVKAITGLLMHFAEEVGARFIIRGLRALSDFEYEFQMVGMNARLNPNIETVFLMASERHQFISSRLVKEVARLGGDVSSFVPKSVQARLSAALAEESARSAAND
ncbi:MAG TPA: pantetheine-phosphate adenylyltransferase [Alphaproteobacteria bacterium]|jgi:pantetheine-phosphate adenylyltransferase|nr:pantetheine-phosphate adenylyltransferase [Alphaproteobacteria bacterium]